MEVDQKSKHKCKFCSKIFPCGRSLGGHMRSHLINISSTEKKLPPLNKVCKECGKAFHSWKALFGHMKSHSAVNEEDSSDEAAALCTRKRSHRYSSPDLSPCSDQEEVALSLILLSMDCINSPLQSHHNSFESNNKMRDRAPKKRLKSNGCSESEVNSPRTLVKRNGPFGPLDQNNDENKNKNKYQNKNKKKCSLELDSLPAPDCKFRCMICNKAFPSYQALGGHRASHKKFKGCCAPTTTPPSPKLAQNLEECKKSTDHECPICFKIFPSGQALGGHKRSHLINDEAKDDIPISSVERRIPQVRDFLDLNLPAPLEEDCSELKPWWIGPTHEPLLGLLSS